MLISCANRNFLERDRGPEVVGDEDIFHHSALQNFELHPTKAYLYSPCPRLSLDNHMKLLQ